MFGAILRSLDPSGRFREALTHRQKGAARERRARKLVDLAFNLLVISKGVRDMGLIDLPRGWAPRAEWNLRVGREMTCDARSRSCVRFVANAAAVSQGALDALGDAYLDTRARLDPRVEREMGERLGYLQPHIRDKRDIDGVVRVHLHLPEAGQGARGTVSRRVVLSEYGPQSICSRDLRFRDVRELKERLSEVARSAHPQLEAHVSVILG